MIFRAATTSKRVERARGDNRSAMKIGEARSLGSLTLAFAPTFARVRSMARLSARRPQIFMGAFPKYVWKGTARQRSQTQETLFRDKRPLLVCVTIIVLTK